MEFYPKVEKYITEIFAQSPHFRDIKHFERTVYWLKKLRPDADEALCIAAFAHDTERAFRESGIHPMAEKSSQGFLDETFMKYHQEKGAEIIVEFLKKQDAPSELTERTSMLISKHEVGGNEDQNLLKDADSISYFENQIDFFLTHKVTEVGKDKVKDKFQWMFDRISSEDARALAKPMYEQAIKRLEE
ncbi:MAG: DUF4202 family protein [Patescibacteria group bacterium]|nr:DUF4202 family protein [Patescibacteria group bacterium]